MFNRLETQRRLDRLEKLIDRLCCRPCSDNLGEINYFTQMAENSTLIATINGQTIDGADGFFSVEGHAYFGGGTFTAFGNQIMTFVTGGTLIIRDADNNIIFNEFVDPGFQYTMQCIEYGSFSFIN